MKNAAKTTSVKKSKAVKPAAGAAASATDQNDKRGAGSRRSVDKGNPTASELVPTERVKLVRDSFTMPRDEFALIAKLKSRALDFKRPTKKSELLRAGLQRLDALDQRELRAALTALRALPTGRPKKAR